ncbi:MAG: hypothetical protein ACRDGL_02485 [Candidatus Limnocylindrales bacterium]
MSAPQGLVPVGGAPRRAAAGIGILALALVLAGLAGELEHRSPSPFATDSGPSGLASGLAPQPTAVRRSFALPSSTPWPTAEAALSSGPARFAEPTLDRPAPGSGALHVRASGLPPGLEAVAVSILGPAGPLVRGHLPAMHGSIDGWLRLEPDRSRAQPLTVALTDPTAGRPLGRAPFVLAPASEVVPSLPFLPGAVIAGPRIVVEGSLAPGIWTVGIRLSSGRADLSSAAQAFIDRTHSPAIVEFMAPMEPGQGLSPGPAVLTLQGFDPAGQAVGQPVSWPIVLAP